MTTPPSTALDIKKYTHVPLFVDAVRVTAENMAEVARWCEGTIQKDPEEKHYIKVAAVRTIRDRQTMAYVGDWVLKTAVGLKVYTNKSFTAGFVPVNSDDSNRVVTHIA